MFANTQYHFNHLLRANYKFIAYNCNQLSCMANLAREGCTGVNYL